MLKWHAERSGMTVEEYEEAARNAERLRTENKQRVEEMLLRRGYVQ